VRANVPGSESDPGGAGFVWGGPCGARFSHTKWATQVRPLPGLQGDLAVLPAISGQLANPPCPSPAASSLLAHSAPPGPTRPAHVPGPPGQLASPGRPPPPLPGAGPRPRWFVRRGWMATNRGGGVNRCCRTGSLAGDGEAGLPCSLALCHARMGPMRSRWLHIYISPYVHMSGCGEIYFGSAARDAHQLAKGIGSAYKARTNCRNICIGSG
jgi:hypothetical protein